ncbi:hypothetical protein ACIRG5_29525 [Lentzea sp. NPDC102401]
MSVLALAPGFLTEAPRVVVRQRRVTPALEGFHRLNRTVSGSNHPTR